MAIKDVVMGTFSVLTVSVSISYLLYCTIDFQDVTIGRKWVKGIQNVCILLTACESTIISN